MNTKNMKRIHRNKHTFMRIVKHLLVAFVDDIERTPFSVYGFDKFCV